MRKYTKKDLSDLIVGKLRRNFGRGVDEATSQQMFQACALVIRDMISARQLESAQKAVDTHARQVHYLSMEFLMGRSLRKNAYNLGIIEPLTKAVESLGFSAAPPPERPPEEAAAASPAELAKRLFQENEWGRQAMVRQGVLAEIAGRFGGIIAFRPLDAQARQAVTVKQIQALGREYGLEVAQVDPDTAQALTPGPEALSARSSVCVLESLLAPLFSEACGLRRCRLSGPPEALRLLYCGGISSSSTELFATS